MHRLGLLVVLVTLAGCGYVMLHTPDHPVTGRRVMWPYPHRWLPEGGPEVRGDALSAIQAALGYHLQVRARAIRSWEDRCSDSARAMDVSFMVDEAQQLVFVKIDEVPEKRCPDGPLREFAGDDGGVIVVRQKPLAPIMVDGINVYAVTFGGQILDRYRQGHPDFELPPAGGEHLSGDEPAPSGNVQPPDGGVSILDGEAPDMRPRLDIPPHCNYR